MSSPEGTEQHQPQNVLLLHGKLVEVLYEEERPGDGIEPGDGISKAQAGHDNWAVASTERHALSWTRPPAITAASSPPASGTRSRSWSRPCSLYSSQGRKVRRRRERGCVSFGVDAGDIVPAYTRALRRHACRLAHVGATIVLVDLSTRTL